MFLHEFHAVTVLYCFHVYPFFLAFFFGRSLGFFGLLGFGIGILGLAGLGLPGLGLPGLGLPGGGLPGGGLPG